jgi:hypothetical protein
VINPSPLIFVERERIARLALEQGILTTCQLVDMPSRVA